MLLSKWIFGWSVTYLVACPGSRRAKQGRGSGRKPCKCEGNRAKCDRFAKPLSAAPWVYILAPNQLLPRPYEKPLLSSCSMSRTWAADAGRATAALAPVNDVLFQPPASPSKPRVRISLLSTNGKRKRAMLLYLHHSIACMQRNHGIHSPYSVLALFWTIIRSVHRTHGD